MNQTEYNELVEKIEDETANLITILVALKYSLDSTPHDMENVFRVSRGVDAAKPMYRRILRMRKQLQINRKDPFLSEFFELAEVNA